MARLEKKVAIVTGGGGGLGREIARAFVAEGAAAVIVADLDPTSAQQTVTELSGAGTEVVASRLDVCDAEQVERLVQNTVERHGRLDVMINNAGMIAPVSRIHQVSPEDFCRVVDVNLTGVFNGIRSSVKVLRESGGAIINTSSVAGLSPWTHTSAYGAAKAAVIHLTRIAAREYAPDIRVNCVCPGTMHTPMNDALPDGALENITRDYPMGRLADPSEVAPIYVYLASDESRWTTGAVLPIDGGYTAR